MPKQISASDAKNNFGGLLDDVAALGQVEIIRHGRLVAIVLSPRALEAALKIPVESGKSAWGETHMIPSERARAAKVIRGLSRPQIASEVDGKRKTLRKLEERASKTRK
jgi:prevent-host-death family protein